MSVDPQIAFAVRPMPGEQACGDLAAVWDDGDAVLVAVIDGLGHGPLAAAASEAAAAYVSAHRSEGLVALISGCDRAIRATRGVVMTLLRLTRSTGAACHAAIGNVEARLVSDVDVPLLTTPGVVGARLRRLTERNFVLSRGSTLILYTDGVSSRFRADELHGRSAEAIVRELLRHHAKDHDDAGCAVIVT